MNEHRFNQGSSIPHTLVKMAGVYEWKCFTISTLDYIIDNKNSMVRTKHSIRVSRIAYKSRSGSNKIGISFYDPPRRKDIIRFSHTEKGTKCDRNNKVKIQT